MPSSRELTLVFTDIEGSTRMWEQDSGRMSAALLDHDRLVRAAFCEGTVVKSMGDGVLATFAQPAAAVAAAHDLQVRLSEPANTHGVPLRVRCGLHVGAVELRDDDCFGPAVNRAARIMAAAHGGQVLLSHAAAARVRDALPGSASLRDLGKVRLKDLANAEQVFQLVHPALPCEFPPLRSLASVPNNLPQQTTSFVGREDELRVLAALLAKSRLLTLTGSGGCGKTRLALQVAANDLEHFVDGVWLVELAHISDGAQVAGAIVSVIGLREDAAKPAVHSLVDYLRDKRVLMLLDNCEHLLDESARVAEAILEGCPGVTVLATSREGLGIAGEQSYRVPSLALPASSALPTADSVSACEAVQLFADRACLARPDFAVTDANAASVASICRRLDGIPLALELAAARIRALSIGEIEQRLDHRFRLLTGGSRAALPRQQTLRSTIDWSYELLSDVERSLFARLAVFSGGFTLDAAEAVCTGEDLAAEAVLDVLSSLVDKSLVAVEEHDGHSRYAMLETVRQYARELLVDSGAGPALLARNLDYFLQFAEAAAAALSGPGQAQALRQLDEEHDNLKACLEWGLGDADSASGIRLCMALVRFWQTRGHFAEGRRWCARALSRTASASFAKERARLHNSAGLLAYHQSDLRAALSHFTEALALARAASDDPHAALILGNMGLATCDLGELAAARSQHEESLAILRRLGDKPGTARALNNLAGVAYAQRDFAAAQAMLEQGLVLKRELGDPARVASTLGNLGKVALEQGDLRAARRWFREALAITQEIGARAEHAMTLESLGRIALEEGDSAAAYELGNESLAIMRELDHAKGVADALQSSGRALLARGDRAGGMQRLAESIARYRERGDLSNALESLRTVASAVAREGDYRLGAPLLGACDRLGEPFEAGLEEAVRRRRADEFAAARSAAPDPVSFERAWNAGRAMDFDQAVELFLAAARPPS